MADESLRPSLGFDYYLKDSIYWNDFELVSERMSELVSGHPAIGWIAHVKNKYGIRNKGLFVSCGNGWVERDCFNGGLVREIVGFDVMQEGLALAEKEAASIKMPATYLVADGNNLNISQTGFDLIVNNGSMHHIAYLDRLLRQLHSFLLDGGIYVINDYTGPHRNQYSWEAWARTIEINESLPADYRIELNYAHMPTMIHMDPTEAIHSELEMDVTRRYFDIDQEVKFGGAIAYTLLFGNRKLFEDRHTPLGIKVIQTIMAADAHFVESYPSTNLFSFAVCRPKSELPSQAVRDRWSAEENEREVFAASNGGRYYPPTPLELIYNRIADLEYRLRIS